MTAAAASSGVELIVLDNRYDEQTALRNAEEFVTQRVDMVLEFQAEESVAPHVAHILKIAGIPVIAIDVPHPSATYFGVDNFEVGYEAGLLLAAHAQRAWKSEADWVVGIGQAEAGSFVQSALCPAGGARVAWSERSGGGEVSERDKAGRADSGGCGDGLKRAGGVGCGAEGGTGGGYCHCWAGLHS